MSDRDALTQTILRVIQRTSDTRGNVTMIRLATAIAAELDDGDDLRARLTAMRDDWERRGEYGDVSLTQGARCLSELLAGGGA